MKTNPFPFPAVAFLSLFAVLAQVGRTQPCAPGTSLAPLSLRFTSVEGTASLIGFDEFVVTSPVPKVYRRKQIEGRVDLGRWGGADCPPPTFPDAYSDGGTVSGQTSPGWPYHPFGWSAALEPVATAPDGRVLYRAATSGNPPSGPGQPDGVEIFIQVDQGMPGNADDVIFANGEEKYLDPLHTNPPFSAAAFSPQMQVWGAALGATARRFRSRNIVQFRDTWNVTQEYDQADPSGTALAIDTDLGARFHQVSPEFPGPGAGTLSGSPATADYAGLVVEALTPTSRALTGTESCVPASGGMAKAVGSYVETLSVEDTEAEAENRAHRPAAIASGDTTVGTNNVVYRTNRFLEGPDGHVGRSFNFGHVHYEARFGRGCPGDYNLFVVYSEYSLVTGEQSGPRRKVLRQLRLGESEQVVTGDVTIGQAPFSERDIYYAILRIEAESLCGDAAPGTSGAELGSIRFWMNLGRAGADMSAGQLRLDAAGITPEIYTPAALSLAVAQSVASEAVRDGSGDLRQVRTPQALADIVVLNTSAYEVRFHAPSQLGAPDSDTGIYPVNGSPFVTYRFENPDPGEISRLVISEIRGAQAKVTEYRHDPAAATWLLIIGGGLRNESEVESTDSGGTVRTRTVRDALGAVVSRTARTYRTFDWGEELVREVLDPDGAALTTEYEFYDDGSPGDPNHGRLRQRIDREGGWQRFTYDATGRVLKVVGPFLDVGPATVDEAACRVTENIYDLMEDADGDGLAEARTTTLERVLGRETARRYRIDWSRPVTLQDDVCQRRSDIVCTAAGAVWNAADNLVTETLRHASGPFVGLDRFVRHADGAANLWTRVLGASGVLTTTSKTGQPNAARDDIVDGSSRVTVTNVNGQVVSETFTDLASALLLTRWTASEFDFLGRPTRITHDDGTYELRSYACCGLESSRDRFGVVTDYLYDALGRTIVVTRRGISTVTGYDADGRVKSVVRVGTDSSSIVQETNAYDLAGRLRERFDAMGRRTVYAESFESGPGYLRRTVTNPDGGTSIASHARDGSPLGRAGTAVAPRAFEYGVDGDGLYTKDTAIGEDAAGQPTDTEWTKTYTDFAGRPHKVLFADGAVDQSFFNQRGQRVRHVDPDGVTTLFAYNARGEQETIAVDLNANLVIDYAGGDRITRTTTSVAARTEGAASYNVQRVITQVWETNGVDLPVTVSVAEQTGDGLHAWSALRGLVTSTRTVPDGAGASTVTTIAPDGVKTIQVYAGDQLIASRSQTAADALMAGASYAYDAHGRRAARIDARNGATTYTYQDDDQLHSVTSPDPDASRSGGGYESQTVTYQYDPAGRITAVTEPDGGIVTTTYWLTGKVRRVSGARTYPVEYSFDPQGRLKTMISWRDFAANSGMAVTRWHYDPRRGFLLAKRYADNTGPDYGYNLSGRPLSRTWARPPRTTTTYGYNAAGELATVNYSDATPDVSVVHDRTGRPRSIVDGSGARTLGYAPSGMLAYEAYNGSVLAGLGINREYDALHRPSRVSVPAVPSVPATNFTYDQASRLQAVSAGSNTMTYDYLPLTPLVRAVNFRNGSNNRLSTNRDYDHLNRLGSISNTPSAGATFGHRYDYNASNQRTRATREDNSHWNYGYDGLGQVTSGQKFLGDGSVALGLAHAYAFDDIGNRTSATVNAATATYVSNALNQYAQRTVPGSLDVLGAASATSTVTVALDGSAPQATTRQGEGFYRQIPVNNASAAQRSQLRITGVRNLVGPNGEDAVTEIVRSAFVARSPEMFVQDEDGNLREDARWLYTWDAENRLIALETAAGAAGAGVPRKKLEFAYDHHGRRWGRKVSDWNGSGWTLVGHTVFLYDGWNLLAEFDALHGNAPIRSHLWGLDLSGSLQGAGGVGGLLSTTNHAGGETHFAAYDGNGNLAGWVNAATGAISAKYDYSPFGETLASEGPFAAGSPFGFSSKYADFETGHVYFGYRWYQPATGRWLSRDPYEEEGGVNLYSFVGNAPTEWVDPLGLALYAFDGTNNDGYRDEPKRNETNVFILAKVYRGNTAYLPGVGTNDGLLNPFGAAFGAGGQARESEMLTQAGAFIENGDTIADIIGFSRGAAQARDFANKLKEKYPCVRIRWIGLFDTVASEGLPNNINIGYRLGIPTDTGSVLHLTAGGERRRRTFALSSIRPGPGLPNTNSSFREEEIPDAVHSDVGGFYGHNRGLANQALQRMWRDGLNHNVPFGPLNVRYSTVAPRGSNDSRWINDKVIEFLSGKPRTRKVYFHP